MSGASVAYPGREGAHSAVACEALFPGAAPTPLPSFADVVEAAASGEVAFGPSAETIARLAEERECSLIVMGTRGRHPMVNLFTGSVPSRVVQRARVPVMLVRQATDARLHLPPRRQHASPFIAA